MRQYLFFFSFILVVLSCKNDDELSEKKEIQLSTTEITEITELSAISGGTVIYDGANTVTSRGICWSTTKNPLITDFFTIDGKGTGNFSSELEELQPETTYYVRAYATNGSGTIYGNELNFTTQKEIQVSTTEITEITELSAISGGTVIFYSGSDITSRGICWSTTKNPLLTDFFKASESGADNFSSTIDKLQPETTYYVRAYATRSNETTTYGDELYFTTQKGEASVFDGDVHLKTQEEVDTFGALNYTEITGDLYIGDGIINSTANLGPLSQLEKVGGHMSIYKNENLTNLKGLESLMSVGSLTINGNNALENLDGLANLTEVGASLEIKWNYLLSNIDALINITTVKNDLIISRNDFLEQIDGLSNIVSVEGDFFIGFQHNMANINGLKNLTSIGGYLWIADNHALKKLDGLQNLEQIQGKLHITGNFNNLDGLENLTSIGESLRITSNFELNNLDGLNNLNSIGGDLEIRTNPLLLNLNGLNGLKSIPENLVIERNLQLANIDGLTNVTEIGGDVTINSNDITNVNAFSTLTSIKGNLLIIGNDALYHIDGLENITNVGGYLFIEGNDTLSNINGLSNIASVNGSLSIKFNDALVDLCGLQLLVQDGLHEDQIVGFNAYNPSVQDILDGNCKL